MKIPGGDELSLVIIGAAGFFITVEDLFKFFDISIGQVFEAQPDLSPGG